MTLVDIRLEIKKACQFVTDRLTLLGLIVPLSKGIIPGLFQGECSMILQFELSCTQSNEERLFSYQ